MATVLVVYASDYGSTEKMAQAAAAGVESVSGVKAVLKKAEEVSAEDFTSSDGVLVGTPVHMGSMDWRVKKMIDTVCSGLWMQDRMNGKVAGVFVSGSGYGGAGGGAELTFLSVLNNFAELGMIIVPLPKTTEGYKKGGLQWGPYGRSADEDMKHGGVSEDVLGVARRHGAHVAALALALADKKIFT
ncbi:MAG: NAD(P)H-dependent oxidoreductase [Desulfofustis sp.]|nr:NAD(P)H-dependent oxidoreductase [Desulfofustis sp.]